MLRIAYLANLFPSAVEPYVVDEVEALRGRGVQIVTGSVRKRGESHGETPLDVVPEIVLQSMSFAALVRAAVLCIERWPWISGLVKRALLRGHERPLVRLKALVHTFLGACYASLLERCDVDHIHVHHGYFGSWVAMTAARLLDVGFSMTLHGSDLLLHGAFLDVKLAECTFCLTVSEYNREYILSTHATIDPRKVIVSRLGVEVGNGVQQRSKSRDSSKMVLLAVGRLQAVKDHAFLIKACAELRAAGVALECSIAGEGPERGRLESLIREHNLEGDVNLLGHVAREQMDSLYERADLVVLTSRSEGIPLVLMEAMARRKIVLAPAITGIPELVIPGESGFLYKAQCMEDFLSQFLVIRSLMQAEAAEPATPRPLHWVREAARVQVVQNFNRRKNLEMFCDLLLSRVQPRTESLPHEDLVLQQI